MSWAPCEEVADSVLARTVTAPCAGRAQILCFNRVARSCMFASKLGKARKSKLDRASGLRRAVRRPSSPTEFSRSKKNWAARMRPKSGRKRPRRTTKTHYQHRTRRRTTNIALRRYREPVAQTRDDLLSGGQYIPLHEVAIFPILNNGRSAASATIASLRLDRVPVHVCRQLPCIQSGWVHMW